MSHLETVVENACVALVGRPNVGKSTLFNLLTRTRKAVVKNQPGVTRDIQVDSAEWWGKSFDVIDTGGITEAKDHFSPLIKEQVLSVLKSVDLLVVIMDGKTGLVPEDRDLVKIAKESGKPFLIVVNKIDQLHQADMILSEFYEFGMDVVASSFERQSGTDEVVEWVTQNLPKKESVTRGSGVRITIVGKPNVGKSSLCNFLLGEKRMIVSEKAGTTVDSIETPFEHKGQKFILVDTAGLRKARKRKKLNDGVEILSAFKSEKSLKRADVVLLMVDVCEGPTTQDLNIAEKILEEHKAVILVANKEDLGKKTRPELRKWFREKVAEEFHFFPNIPVAFISAETGAGIDKLFEKVEEVWEKLQTRISTSKLNDFFYETIRQAPAPVYGTRNVKFYYLTQTKQMPPSFIAFANHPKGVTPSYRRFLTKKIQKRWDLEGIPVRMFIMKSGQ